MKTVDDFCGPICPFQGTCVNGADFCIFQGQSQLPGLLDARQGKFNVGRALNPSLLVPGRFTMTDKNQLHIYTPAAVVRSILVYTR